MRALTTGRTSVRATANPSLLLSLGLASPRISLRIEYETSCALSVSRASSSVDSEVSSPSEASAGENSNWNLCKVVTSLAVASNLSFFLDEERFQKSSRVVDIISISSQQYERRYFFGGREVSIT